MVTVVVVMNETQSSDDDSRPVLLLLLLLSVKITPISLGGLYEISRANYDVPSPFWTFAAN